MSRRNTAIAVSHGARHAQDRLSATLGNSSSRLLDPPDGHPPFSYGGDARPDASEDAGESPQTGYVGPVFRWRLGLRVSLLLAIVSVLAGGWFWWQIAAAQPEVAPLNQETPTVSATATGSAAQESVSVDHPEGGTGEHITIHVAGAVSQAGVVELPKGSRVHSAITAAGGGTATADLNQLNLAAVLEDGQKVYVVQHGESIPSLEGFSVGGGSAVGGLEASTANPVENKINLNSAGVEELGTLPRVGPVLAQRIVDWRTEHGPFRAAEELDAVDGVGPKMLETLLPLVSV